MLSKCDNVSNALPSRNGKEVKMMQGFFALLIVPVAVGVIVNVISYYICKWLDNRKEKDK